MTRSYSGIKKILPYVAGGLILGAVTFMLWNNQNLPDLSLDNVITGLGEASAAGYKNFIKPVSDVAYTPLVERCIETVMQGFPDAEWESVSHFSKGVEMIQKIDVNVNIGAPLYIPANNPNATLFGEIVKEVSSCFLPGY